MYLPGILPSGNAPPNGSFTASTGGFFNGEPSAGNGSAEAPPVTDGAPDDDGTDALLQSLFPNGGPLGYFTPNDAPAPVAHPGYGEWLPGSPAVLDALNTPGIEIREHFTMDNTVAERGVCPEGVDPTNAPAAAPISNCAWLLGAAAILTVIGLSGGEQSGRGRA